MRITNVIATLMILCLAPQIHSAIPVVYAQTQKGPRSGGLDMCFYTSPDT